MTVHIFSVQVVWYDINTNREIRNESGEGALYRLHSSGIYNSLCNQFPSLLRLISLIRTCSSTFVYDSLMVFATHSIYYFPIISETDFFVKLHALVTWWLYAKVWNLQHLYCYTGVYKMCRLDVPTLWWLLNVHVPLYFTIIKA